MPREAVIEKIIRSFKKDEVVNFTESELEYRDRMIYILKLKVKNVAIADYDLFKKVQKKFPKAKFNAVYRDITFIERMIATERNPNADPQKVWARYMVTEMVKSSYKLAKKKKEAYNMSYAASVLGKHNLTDREDVNKPNFDDIIPFVPEITNDPSVVGARAIPEEELKALKEKLLKKYNASDLIQEIQEAEIIEEKMQSDEKEKNQEVLS